MLDADAISVVDTPGSEDHRAVQGGINDLVTIRGDVDTIVPYSRIETFGDDARKRNEVILDRLGRPDGTKQIFAKEVVLVLGLVFGTQQTVLHRLLQRNCVGDAFRQWLIDINRCQSTVGGKVVAFDNLLYILEIYVFLFHLTAERIGTEVELVYLAVEVGVGVARNVFAQGRECDDERRKNDQQQCHANDDQNQIEQVEPKIEDFLARRIVRHEEVILTIELL